MANDNCNICLYRLKCCNWVLPAVIPDHSLLSPSGKVSGRAYKSSHDRQNLEFREYFSALEQANDDYLKSAEAIAKLLHRQSLTRRDMARLVMRPKKQQQIIREADNLLVTAQAMEAQIPIERPHCYTVKGESNA